MRRYGLPAFLGAWFLIPTAILLLGGRNLLAERVAVLEAEAAELRAELDRQPVVIDANGNQIGTTGIHNDYYGPYVMFDLDGFPLFAAKVFSNRLESPSGSRVLYFEGPNCSGRALIKKDVGDLDDALPIVYTNSVREDLPIYVAGSERVTLNPSTSSVDVIPDDSPACQSRQNQGGHFVEALDTGIHWMTDFTPPFGIVRRSELIEE